jgi:hypothetical protein
VIGRHRVDHTPDEHEICAGNGTSLVARLHEQGLGVAAAVRREARDFRIRHVRRLKTRVFPDKTLDVAETVAKVAAPHGD